MLNEEKCNCNRSKAGVEPIEIIYSKVPQALKEVFDTAVQYRSGEICDDNFEVFIDFGYLKMISKISKLYICRIYYILNYKDPL